MEEEFLNLGLDIIGLGVFNYDFGSITTESPVIKVSFAQCTLSVSAECVVAASSARDLLAAVMSACVQVR